ncbi:hypothetical protein BDB00DRAFT_853221 [Zychaea mexicana]|uniref:uncharacterized protein n=1 Tax=Zychaea mexicana TaxID=64656 RepID=UPI0022FE7957|nr:uncharacterized protein BDB00DRAFT_853221 [Zychaea mexicana]KAI9484845.1 hypothetical protein BDB00DRAFT_853221 [Zychaea mexicana]
MIRPPSIQAVSRVQQPAVCFRKYVSPLQSSSSSSKTTKRSVHAESTNSSSSDSLLTTSNGSVVDYWNPIHFELLFNRKQQHQIPSSSVVYSPMLRHRSSQQQQQQQQRQQQEGTDETASELIVAPDIIEQEPLLLKKESHLFDTYEQVTHLQAWGGFSRGEAKAVMETIQQLLRMSVAKQTDQFLTSSQLENESYLISAAVAEFRREVQLLRRNDSALLQSELTALAREVESLEQRLSEDLGTMRDETELTMNDYRSDIREEQKITEHQIQGINNRLTVSLGDAATELESLKWNVIWRGLLGGLVTALGITAVGYALSALRSTRAAAVQRKEAIKSAGDNLSYADMELS